MKKMYWNDFKKVQLIFIPIILFIAFFYFITAEIITLALNFVFSYEKTPSIVDVSKVIGFFVVVFLVGQLFTKLSLSILINGIWCSNCKESFGQQEIKAGISGAIDFCGNCGENRYERIET